MDKTVIISCAGKGSRLGLEKPKCLVDVAGKKVIERQLEQLENVDEIIVVVGYKKDEVVDFVKSLNKKVKFVCNDDYEHTGTAASFSLGAKEAKNDFLIALDGDLLVHPEDMKNVLNEKEEFACGEELNTEEPVFMNLNTNSEVINFNRENGDLEWSGLMGIKKENITEDCWYIYHLIEPLMPIKALKIRAKEIDTPLDLKEAKRWIDNNFDEKKIIIDEFFKSRFTVKDPYVAVRYRENNRDYYDMNLINEYCDENSEVLDLGCGTGVLEKKLFEKVKHIDAVEKYEEFIKKAFKEKNIDYIIDDVSDYKSQKIYDLILLFGVTIYLNDEEIKNMLNNVKNMMNENSNFIIKNQWGIDEELIVDKYSEEMNSKYYAVYRKLSKFNELLEKEGFNTKTVDIYPKKLNRWENTHEYAIILNRKMKR